MSVDVGGGDAAKSEPNVVPLCDILLVLLIIFMVVTPMIQKGANVTLPDASYTQDQPEPGKMVTVDIANNGDIYCNDKLVPIEQINTLPKLIQDTFEEKSQEDKTKVLLRAGKEVAYGKVVDVLDIIKDAEIEVIGLLAEKVSQ